MRHNNEWLFYVEFCNPTLNVSDRNRCWNNIVCVWTITFTWMIDVLKFL